MVSKHSDPGHGLAFDLLSRVEKNVVIGHSNGLIPATVLEKLDFVASLAPSASRSSRSRNDKRPVLPQGKRQALVRFGSGSAERRDQLLGQRAG